MKKFKVTLSLLTLLAVFALQTASHTTSLIYSATVSATDANTAVTFTDNGSGGTSAAFTAIEWIVENTDGTNEIFVDWKDTTATSSDKQVRAGKTFGMRATSVTAPAGWTGIGIICSTGETATVLVTAVR